VKSKGRARKRLHVRHGRPNTGEGARRRYRASTRGPVCRRLGEGHANATLGRVGRRGPRRSPHIHSSPSTRRGLPTAVGGMPTAPTGHVSRSDRRLLCWLSLATPVAVALRRTARCVSPVASVVEREPGRVGPVPRRLEIWATDVCRSFICLSLIHNLAGGPDPQSPYSPRAAATATTSFNVSAGAP